MCLCYLHCPLKSFPTKRSAMVLPTAFMTPASARMPSLLRGPPQSCYLAGASSPRCRTPLELARSKNALRTSRRLGRTTWTRIGDYQRRNREEIKIQCVTKLGQHPTELDLDCRVTEFRIFVAVMYACAALGLRVAEFVGYAGSGKRSLSHHPTLSNCTPQKTRSVFNKQPR